MHSHYAVLGIPADSTNTMIRKAYLRRSRELHPDKELRNDDASAAEFVATRREMLFRVQEAYAALRDPETRAAHDASLRYSLHAQCSRSELRKFAQTASSIGILPRVNAENCASFIELVPDGLLEQIPEYVLDILRAANAAACKQEEQEEQDTTGTDTLLDTEVEIEIPSLTTVSTSNTTVTVRCVTSASGEWEDIVIPLAAVQRAVTEQGADFVVLPGRGDYSFTHKIRADLVIYILHAGETSPERA